MVRNLLFAGSLFFVSIASLSQTIDEAKQLVYYERWNSAEDVLKKIIAAQPDQPEAYYYLGELYLAQNKVDAAHTIIQQGVQAADKNGMDKKQHSLIYVGQTHLLLNDGKNEDATKQFDDLLGMTKYKDASLLEEVARVHILSPKGDANEAIQLLEKAAKRDKKNGEIYVLMGDAYRKIEDASNAFKCYNKSIEIDPSLAEAHHKLGEIFKTQKNPELYIDEFTKAITADKSYAPSLLELYNYYFYSGDFQKAGEYLDRYIASADPSVENDYRKADLFFVTKKYPEAMQTAEAIIQAQGDKAKPRLYKMIAYCNNEEGDSVKALQSINTYFDKEDKKNYVMKDYDLKASLLERSGLKNEAATWYEKAFSLADKEDQKEQYMRKIALLDKEDKDYINEAVWREKIFNQAKSANNVDLFNWGLSLYFAGKYQQSDTVFGVYAKKYPEQLFGYLWQARCNMALDTSMELGLAIPYYEKLVEVALTNKEANRQTLISAYNYLGGYEANIKKDYEKALDYFNKILEIDENNSEALRLTGILKQWIEQQQKDNGKTGSN
ncbi:MAG TPA: tetratricopeptide repeat protein [Chitinophagaceae bacterium]|nr:tetratricopeptide repeat protein [Chitinophagaceae bacterium]